MSGLTKPQRRLLYDLAKAGEVVPANYRPAKRLFALGFIDAYETRNGEMQVYITPAGRTALAQEGDDG